jgi:para-nitrobenzyl esterase
VQSKLTAGLTGLSLDRRTVLMGGAAAMALAACADPVDPLDKDPLIVATSNGRIKGVQENGVFEFRGVRYANPPIGKRRFQAPEPLTAWSSTRLVVDAIAYGQPAIQMRAGAGAAAYPPGIQEAMTEAFRPPENVKAEGDEDCLTLNVYTQATGPKAGATRPVMVWLHGGGFSYGQAALNVYRGHNLAKNHDVVQVGVNHRLNIFGFLPLDTAGATGIAGSANAGLLDCIKALEWVRDNIAMFGGDPGNVTIYGQSGGGAKVSTLLAMPEAKGLFHKAIIQSGAGVRAMEKDDALDVASAFIIGLGISASIAGSTLPSVAAEDILAVAKDMGANKFRPSIDGTHLPRHPFEPDAPPEAADIPVMIGFTKDEQTLYNVGNPKWKDTTEAMVLAAAEKQAPGKGRAIVDAFKAEFPDYDMPHLLMQVTGTVNSLRSSHTLASRKAAQAPPVYAYVFAHDLPPNDFVLKSPHTAEIAYIHDNVAEAPLFAGAAPNDLAMGKLMSSVWVNFARTGDPNVPGLPSWPKFDPDNRSTMFFSKESKVVAKPYQAVWEILQASPNPTAAPL